MFLLSPVAMKVSTKFNVEIPDPDLPIHYTAFMVVGYK